MLVSVLENIICSTFEKEVGRGQMAKGKQFAMDISFLLSVDINVEEGNRNLNIRIFAPSNYVGVLTQETWNYYRHEDIKEYNDESIIFKEGKNHIIGETEWERQSYHDSCWRNDGIHSILYKHKETIITVDSMSNWYKKHEMIEKDIYEFDRAILKKG